LKRTAMSTRELERVEVMERVASGGRKVAKVAIDSTAKVVLGSSPTGGASLPSSLLWF